MTYEILGVDIYHILSWFIVYSFLGWIWESCYVSVKNKRWVNRGFVNGPFVTIYGVGAVAVYVILKPLTGRILELYFAGVAVATVLEYVTGVLMEAIFHTNWWDYSDKKYNFQGKICLGSSLAWGFFTLLLFYVLQPLVSMFVDWFPRSTGTILLYVWLVYYVVDFSFSAAAAFDLRSKLQKLDSVMDEFQESFQNSKLYETVEEFREKAEFYRPEFTDNKLKEYLDIRREKFHEVLERLEDTEIHEKREAFMERYDEFARRYLEVKNSIRHISRRQMKAYPNLISKAERLRKLKEKSKNKGGGHSMGLVTFKGGIHPYDGKELSKNKPIQPLKPQKELAFLVSQHIGAPAKPIVSKGDRVLIGQKIAEAGGFVSAPVYASVSGTVKGIEPRLTATGGTCDAILVENDGLYESVAFEPVEHPEQLSKEEIRKKIQEAGVVGMGGAGFPTHVKLSPKEPEKIDHILVNGAECEPYLTSDYRRMLEEPEKVIGGLKVMLQLFDNAKGCICIEDNKPDCIEKLSKMVENEPRIEVKAMKTKYPQGAERMLIYAVTGRSINSSMLPADAGCVVDNIDTVVAVYKAVVLGQPLMHRIVTVTGDAIAEPANFYVPVGTDFQELVEAAGGFKDHVEKVISGGPMMGFAMFDMHVPVTKTTSALLCLTKDEVCHSETTACINCGRCVSECPEHLLPTKLATFATHKDQDKFQKYNGMECCECGCCSYVCPAKRPLAQEIKSMRKIVLANRKKK